MRSGEIQIPVGDFAGIVGRGEFRFLRERIGVQPVDEALAPARDHSGLRVMHMGIHKPGHDQALTVIHPLCLWRLRLQHVQRSDCCNAAIFDQNGLIQTHRIFGGTVKGRVVKGQHLSREQCLGCHQPVSLRVCKREPD